MIIEFGDATALEHLDIYKHCELVETHLTVCESTVEVRVLQGLLLYTKHIEARGRLANDIIDTNFDEQASARELLYQMHLASRYLSVRYIFILPQLIFHIKAKSTGGRTAPVSPEQEAEDYEDRQVRLRKDVRLATFSRYFNMLTASSVFTTRWRAMHHHGRLRNRMEG